MGSRLNHLGSDLDLVCAGLSSRLYIMRPVRQVYNSPSLALRAGITLIPPGQRELRASPAVQNDGLAVLRRVRVEPIDLTFRVQAAAVFNCLSGLAGSGLIR
jgi:hypothetical protein